MVDRDELRDHPAHGGSDNVRPLDAERVEQGRRVGRHVVERIGRGRPRALLHRGHHRREVRGSERREMGRPSDVPIVEPHGAEALGRKPLAERIGPEDQRRRKAHDQEDRWIPAAAETLVFDVDSVGAYGGHG